MTDHFKDYDYLPFKDKIQEWEQKQTKKETKTMGVWEYDSSQAKEQGFETLPVGEYRIRFEEVELVTAKSGNEMLKINFSVSGHSSRLFHNLVFLPDKPEVTNTNLKAIYDSFGIPAGNMNFVEWVGKVGACKVKHEDYQGTAQAKIAWFIKKEKQDSLPAWQENASKAATKTNTNTSAKSESEIPF
jgi:hypothetical protein